MQKLSTCVLAAAVFEINFIIFCSDGNKAVAHTDPDIGRHVGWIGSQSVYKIVDNGNTCYAIIGGSARPAISCVR